MFDIGYVGIDHERDEIQNGVGALAQDGKGCEQKFLKRA